MNITPIWHHPDFPTSRMVMLLEKMDCKSTAANLIAFELQLQDGIPRYVETLTMGQMPHEPRIALSP